LCWDFPQKGSVWPCRRSGLLQQKALDFFAFTKFQSSLTKTTPKISSSVLLLSHKFSFGFF
jgi:hypothetical protein